jgi:hypothetical protein
MECVMCTLMVDARYVERVVKGARFDLEVARWLLSPRLDLDRLRHLSSVHIAGRPQTEWEGLAVRLKDKLGDQRRGSEWELIKILLQRENSAYAPNSQPRIRTRVCQGHVVIADLPTLGTNAKRSQSESKTQRAKDLAAQHWTRWTVRKHRADRLRGLG